MPSEHDEESEQEEDSRNVENTSHDEAFCTSCGEIIKKEAEVCPECGSRQKGVESETEGGDAGGIPEIKQYELEKVANQSEATVILLSIFLTPLGYYWVGRTGLALLNFFTFNYLLLGPIIVPIHTHLIMKNAREELRKAGVEGY